jgi:alanyl-tRNA synthetase
MTVQPTEDIDKYHGRPIQATIAAIWNGSDFDERTDESHHSDLSAIITDKTNFYAESGGRLGDTGRIVDLDGDRSEFAVSDTKAIGGYVLHIGRLNRGELSIGDTVQLQLPAERRSAIRANHTSTHLLNLALREVLGNGVDQKGSLVADDRLRFDFSFGHAMKPEQIEAVEQIVNTAHQQQTCSVARRECSARKGEADCRECALCSASAIPIQFRVVSIGVPVKELMTDARKLGVAEILDRVLRRHARVHDQ